MMRTAQWPGRSHAVLGGTGRRAVALGLDSALFARVLGVRVDWAAGTGPPSGRGSAGLEGGDGGVDQDVLVGGVGEVERGLGDQGTPDRPQGRLGS